MRLEESRERAGYSSPITVSFKPVAEPALELCYVFKYPETKAPVGERKDSSWIIRQIGLYHQYSLGCDQSTWMLVFNNRRSYDDDEVAAIMKPDKHPLQPHIDFHFEHIYNWRWYMVDLEKHLQNLVMFFSEHGSAKIADHNVRPQASTSRPSRW